MWLNCGSELTPYDIFEAIVLVILMVVAVAMFIFAITITLSNTCIESPPPHSSLLLDIRDYDNDKYKIFLLKSNVVQTSVGVVSYKGDFYHLSELIAKRFTFSDMKNKSTCKVSFALSYQNAFARRRAVDNFNGVLFYNREENKWFFYRRPPTVKLRFYNKDNAVHVDVKIAIKDNALPDMPSHTNLDDLLSLLLINHNENYTIHFLDIDKEFKRGKLENE